MREVLIYTGGENLRSILALVICIVIVMLCGCVIASEPVEINMPKEVVFEDGSNNIKIVQIGKEIYTEENNVRWITEKVKVSNDNKYAYVMGKIGEEEKLYIMNTMNEKLISSDKSELISNSNPYDIKHNKDIITIVDIISGREIASINLNEVDFEKKNNEFSVVYDWSATYRYLLLSDPNTDKQVLFDVHRQRLLNIPVNERIYTTWSQNDSLVILHPIYSVKVKRTYIWDMTKSTVKEIGEDFVRELKWMPDEKYIYYKDTVSINGFIGNKIVRYDIDNDCWNDIYSTKMSIQEDSIKWISEDEFIFPAIDSTKTQDPVKMLMKPYTEYAVKVDIKNNKETIIELKAFLAKDYIWSYDNRYIYYLDQNGFYKEEVNF